MTPKIKLCGLRRTEDIQYANELSPEYIGFVFARKSKRYVSPDEAAYLRSQLKEGIIPVGVFVDEDIETICSLLEKNIIGAVQLHGNEGEDYIARLRQRTAAVIIQAFRINSEAHIEAVEKSTADHILLDSGCGSGEVFDHSILKKIRRSYFLAGGLTPDNIGEIIAEYHPFAVDVSSSIETNGFKDKNKMTAFVNAVRKEHNND